MNPSWDEITSMASVDLLSVTSGDQGDIHPSESNLEQISEETNANHELSAAAIGGSPSPMASSLEKQQHTIYQIDFDVEHNGKNKPSSKRMAVWKYGIPRQSANGSTTLTGHEAKLTWSTHSGKYTISVDGEEVFSSVAKGSVLEHKWKWSHSKACVSEDDADDDSVAMRIIACRKPPVRSGKNFRCYEFLIGGKVFRDLPEESASFGGEFQNEDNVYDYGKLMSILDVIEPGWRASGFA
eukprot:CAMPEP_0172322446 /NCGR_PEP_ID=MMETSP1058-20130122/45898_1 /TAXON_ID=83371 /ORGANISM="Detonula confervacea, Strain CCMP 353" /LENGTH=239 /DNA_ID=CAMNT_0013038185 /DNA_START=40 /DNA_END=759 /DNA_ORIENTATION=-